MSGPTWDEEKHRQNLIRGRIGFDEAGTVLEDPDRVTWPDIQHSLNEDRFITVGISARGRFVRVVTSIEKGGSIRVISARRASKRERHAYETRRPLD